MLTNSKSADILIGAVWKGKGAIEAAQADIGKFNKIRKEGKNTEDEMAKKYAETADAYRKLADEIKKSDKIKNLSKDSKKLIKDEKISVDELNTAYQELARAQRYLKQWQDKLANGHKDGTKKINEWTNKLNQAKAKIGDMSDRMTFSAEKFDDMSLSADRSGVSLGSMAKGALGFVSVAGAVAYGAAQAAQKIFEMGEQGAQIRQLGESFEFFTDKFSVTPNLLEEMRVAAKGTVSDVGLMSNLFTLVAGSSERMSREFTAAAPELLEVAKAASKLNPQLGDTEFMFQSLSKGIKRLEFRLLDNLGLNIKVGDANKKYADSLGKTVQQLTQEEKVLALLNETLEVGKNLTDQVGGSTDSLVDPYDRARAAQENFTNKIKANASATLEAIGIVDLYADTLERWSGIKPPDQQVFSNVFSSESADAARAYLETIGASADDFVTLRDAMVIVSEEVELLGDGFDKEAIAAEAVLVILEKLRAEGLGAVGSAEELAAGVVELAMATDEAAGGVGGLIDNWDRLNIQQQIESQDRIKEAMRSTSIELAKQTGLVDSAVIEMAEMKLTAGATTQEIVNFMVANSRLTSELGNQIIAVAEDEAALRDLADAGQYAMIEQDNLYGTVLQGRRVIERGVSSVEELEKSQEDAAQAAKDAAQALQDDYFEAIEDSKQAGADFVINLIEQTAGLDDASQALLDMAGSAGSTSSEIANAAISTGILTGEQADLIAKIGTAITAMDLAATQHGVNSIAAANEAANVRNLVAQYLQLSAVLNFGQNSVGFDVSGFDAKSLQDYKEIVKAFEAAVKGTGTGGGGSGGKTPEQERLENLTKYSEDLEDAYDKIVDIEEDQTEDLEKARIARDDAIQRIDDRETERIADLDDRRSDLEEAADKRNKDRIAVIDKREQDRLTDIDDKFDKQRQKYEDQITAIGEARDRLLEASRIDYLAQEADEFVDTLERISDPDFDESLEDQFADMVDGFAREAGRAGRTVDEIGDAIEDFADPSHIGEAQRIEDFENAIESLARSDLSLDEQKAALAELNRQFLAGEQVNLDGLKFNAETAAEYALRINKERLDQMARDEKEAQDDITASHTLQADERLEIEEEAREKRRIINQKLADDLKEIGEDYNDDLLDIEQDARDDRLEAESDYQARIAEINSETTKKIEDVLEDLTKKSKKLFDDSEKSAGELEAGILEVAGAIGEELRSESKETFDAMIQQINAANERAGILRDTLSGAAGAAESAGGAVPPSGNMGSENFFGGFTGGGSQYGVAGIVHNQEVVIPNEVRNRGFDDMMSFVANADPLYNNTDVGGGKLVESKSVVQYITQYVSSRTDLAAKATARRLSEESYRRQQAWLQS